MTQFYGCQGIWREKSVTTKFKFYAIFIIILILLGWGGHLIPSRVEITDFGIIQVLGIDSGINNGVNLSMVAENEKGSEDDKPKIGNENIVTSSGKSYNDCISGLENYNDKIFIGGHIESIIIGEEICKENLVRAVDFISKASEIRLNSNVFISKGTNAGDFMREGSSDEFSMAARISNINLVDQTLTEEKNTEVTDVINILLSEDKCGVVQAIELVENGKPSGREFILSNSKGEGKKFMQYAGYALIKDAKLVDYLNIDASSGYDFIKNNHPKQNVYIEKDGEILGINFGGSKTKVSFNFDGEKLKEIVIKTKTKNEIMQSSNGKNIFKENLGATEKLVENEVKHRIESAINVAKNYQVDYIGFKKMLEMKHPYKWNKIKDNWENIFNEVPIRIEVESKINRSYNLLSIVD